MMIKSYLKSGVRSFFANKVSSFINIVGLASTVSIAIAVYLIIDRQMHLDQSHTDHERIYTIQSITQWDKTTETWARTPQLLGPTLMDNLPQIESMTRVQLKSVLVGYGDNVFSERLSFADPEFLNVFNFPLKLGVSQVLTERNSIILGADEAVKYFGTEDPIGKEIRIIIEDQVHLFTVSGVSAELPATASFGFDFLLSIENLPSMFTYDLNTWKDVTNSSVFTYVKLDHPESLGAVEKNASDYLDVINQANPDWPIERFDFEPLTTIARNSQYTVECLPCGSTPEILIIFGIISLILFISACFNYINISIASSSKRLKEIALRKVIGSTRSKIIQQFLVENLVLSFMSVALGVVLAQSIIIPGMNSIFGGDTLSLNLMENSRLVFFIIVMFFVVGIASGSYPAYYISSFKPLDIFRGKGKIGGTGQITKLFLTFQFFLTFIAVVSGLIFTQTNKSQKEQDWGYEKDNLLVLPVQNAAQYNAVSQHTSQLSGVIEQSGSNSQIGRAKTTEVVEINNEKTTVDAFYVDAGYLNTMGLHMKVGSFFNKQLHGDLSNQIIVNETLMEKFGWFETDYESRQLKIGSVNYQIIGVVKDFHHYNFFEPVSASIFKVAADTDLRYLTLKLKQGELKQTQSEMKSFWKDNFPNELYSGFSQDEVFDTFFQQTGQLFVVMNFTSIMAILLSSMGLFGLVSLLIVKRIKELSIRNVLGATQADNARLVASQFLWMLAIAIVLAFPVSYFLFDLLLSKMFLGSPDTLSGTPFLMTLLIILGTIILTVSFHLRQLMRTNPVDNLRMD